MLLDGTGAVGRLGALLHGGLWFGALELGASAAISLPTEVRAPLGPLQLARHDLMATLSWQLGTLRVPLWLGVGAGVAMFDRDTGAGSPQLTSNASRWTPAFAFGPQFGCAFMVGTFGLAFRAALDVIPDGPQFVYRGPGAPAEPAYVPPVLTPRVGVGVQARLP